MGCLLRICLNYMLKEDASNRSCYQNTPYCKVFVLQLDVVASSPLSKAAHISYLIPSAGKAAFLLYCPQSQGNMLQGYN